MREQTESIAAEGANTGTGSARPAELKQQQEQQKRRRSSYYLQVEGRGRLQQPPRAIPGRSPSHQVERALSIHKNHAEEGRRRRLNRKKGESEAGGASFLTLRSERGNGEENRGGGELRGGIETNLAASPRLWSCGSGGLGFLQQRGV